MNNTNGSRRWLAMGAMTLAVLAVGLDATVLSLALPTLSSALHASESDLQWFVSAYALVLAVAMLPSGLLGDRYGRKKVMLGALSLFGASSLACAYSTSVGAFIIARILLAAAGAGLVTMIISTITVLFSVKERPRAVGIWAAANFLALPLGPLLGGWVLAHYWWGWVFLINVPIVLLALTAVAILVPESRSPERPGFDILGILSSCSGLAAITYGLIQAGSHGWGDAIAWAWLFAGVLMLLAFGLWERRLTQRPGGQPLIDITLFRSASFTWGTILAAAGILAMYGALFTVPQYLQAIIGTNAQGAGVRLLPMIGGLTVGAILSSRVAAKIGAKFTVALGFAILAGGMMIGAMTSLNSNSGFLAVWTTICGAGMGFGLSTAASAALSQLSAERSGVGGALMQAVQKLGGPFGAAIMGSVLNTGYISHLDLASLPSGLASSVKQSVYAGIAVAKQLASPSLLTSVRSSFVDGMDNSLLVSMVVAIVCIVLALIFLPKQATTKTTDVM